MCMHTHRLGYSSAQLSMEITEHLLSVWVFCVCECASMFVCACILSVMTFSVSQ